MRQIFMHERNGMHRRAAAVAVLLALPLVLATCGESDPGATSDEASERPTPTLAATHTPKIEPTPAPAPTATPQPEPTPAPAPTATPQIEPTPAPTSTPQPEPTPAESASGEVASSDPLDIAEHLREKTAQLWEVYNKYDLDALKTFYEENYWNRQEAEIKSNMQPIKSFGLTLKAEETSPPTEIAQGKWEIRQTASFSLGSVKMVFIYEEFDGDWLLTYAEDE